MRRELKLNEVVGVLQNTCRSIDIRAAIAKQKGIGKWTCIFLKIRLTSDSKSEVEAKYESKRSNLAIHQKENFQLLGEHRCIEELNSIIKEIEAGEIKINGKYSNLLHGIR